jgi:D-3-phosphoglycerate dehydrogenase
MTKPHILSRNPFPAPIDKALDDAFVVHRPWRSGEEERALTAASASVRGIATNSYQRADEALFAGFPQLEIVASFSVGTDHIDLDAARRRGIRVTNTPEVLNGCVADLGMALVLGLLRKIADGDRHVRSGAWARGPLPLGHAVNGRCLGILGLGAIGMLLARRARAFDMRIAYCNRRQRSDVDYEYHSTPQSLAKAADILVCILPGGAQATRIIDASVLEALGEEGFFVNLGRGQAVDDEALLAALASRRIRGAALDVFRNEPTPAAAFLSLDNVLLSPHQGSATHETRRAMGELMVANLTAHFAGQPLPTPVLSEGREQR